MNIQANNKVKIVHEEKISTNEKTYRHKDNR